MFVIDEIKEGQVKEVSLPSSWLDITYKQYVDLQMLEEQTLPAYLCYLLNIDIDRLQMIDPIMLKDVYLRIDFLLHPEEIILDEYVDFSLDIGQETWLKYHQAEREVIEAEGNFLQAGPELIRIYTRSSEVSGIDITGLPVGDALPYAIAIKKSFEEFSSNYTVLSESNLTPEQEAARLLPDNTDCFENLGLSGTLYALSKGNPLIWNDLLKLPAIMIYDCFLVSHTNAGYDRRYKQIMDSKHK